MSGSISRIQILSANNPSEPSWHHTLLNACARIGRTDVLCLTADYTKLPAKSYDGTVFIHRIPLLPVRAELLIALTRLLAPDISAYMRYQQGMQQLVLKLAAYLPRVEEVFPHHLSVNYLEYCLQSQLLFRYARTVSIQPSLLICLDPIALEAGRLLRQLAGWHVLYDDTNSRLLDDRAFHPNTLKGADSVIAFRSGIVNAVKSSSIRRNHTNSPMIQQPVENDLIRLLSQEVGVVESLT